MANDFNKEEIVAFDELIEGFDDQCVMSSVVKKYSTNDQQMERARNTIWRPQPYIAVSYDGQDQTPNFQNNTQLSVPSTLDTYKSVPWMLDDLELRERLREGDLFDAAKRKLASDINVAVMDRAANEGTLVVKRTTSVDSGSFSDIAACDAIMNEQGVMMGKRSIFLSSRVNNGFANDLSKASRTFGNKMSDTAYSQGLVASDVCGFDIYKLDYANRLAAKTATAAINGANQYYTPKGIDLTQSGQINVDNRYQDIAVTVSAGTLAVGDCFTIDGVFAVHHETKRSTGQLKTFRVIDLLASAGATGTVRISPPIISADGGTDAEKQYQNVSAAPAAAATINLLNTVAADVNPFCVYGAIELLPGKAQAPVNAGAGVMVATTPKNGISLKLTKQLDIKTNRTLYRVDTFFGTVMTNPEMCGILLMGQT